MRKQVLAIILVGCIAGLPGCSTWNRLNNTEKGAVTGGAIGAGTGAIVGSSVGAPGAGIAIGGATGALAGGVIGHEFDSQSSRQTTLEERQRRQEARIKAQQREIDEMRRRE